MERDGSIEKLQQEILVDAYGEDERLWAFRQVIEDEAPLPAEGTVVGETVRVAKIDYDGNPQRGLRATCKKADDKTYEVGLADTRVFADLPVDLSLSRIGYRKLPSVTWHGARYARP